MKQLEAMLTLNDEENDKMQQIYKIIKEKAKKKVRYGTSYNKKANSWECYQVINNIKKHIMYKPTYEAACNYINKLGV